MEIGQTIIFKNYSETLEYKNAGPCLRENPWDSEGRFRRLLVSCRPGFVTDWETLNRAYSSYIYPDVNPTVPTLEQLKTLYGYKEELGLFMDAVYWSSQEESIDEGVGLHFGTGEVVVGSKLRRCVFKTIRIVNDDMLRTKTQYGEWIIKEEEQS
jgi:hypothetical protein